MSALLGATIAVVGTVDRAVPAAAAASLPSGFTDTLVTRVANPTASAAAPRGQILVSSKAGQLTLLRDGIKQPTLAIDLSTVTCSDNERGLLGIAVDPTFAADGSTGSVYLYYTHKTAGGCFNRVSRFTMTGGIIAPASEAVLLDNIASTAGNHNGGDLEFDQSGHLLVSVGDSGCNPRSPTQCSGSNEAAPDRSLLNGKILRIDTDGTPAVGNPYTGAGSERCNVDGRTAPGSLCQEIFAYGFRNPFRIAVNPNASGPRIYANDVGLNTWEEVDDVAGGGNYGWNTYEGPCVTGSTTNCPATFPAGITGPVTFYGRGTGCAAITGGAFVPDGAWPVQYQGAYLYGDYTCGQVWVLRAGQKTAEQFANLGAGGPISMHFVNETGGWSLYYTTFAGGGELHRITADTQPLPKGPARFVPVTPTRILDTRLDVGGSTGKLLAGTAIGLQVTGSVVPPGAIAAALNVTMAEPATAGFLKVWPSRTPQPDVSNVNSSSAGETVANASIIALPPDGQLALLSSTAAHVIVDVSGYWMPAATATAGRFVSATNPARLFDTRFGLNAPPTEVGPGQGLIVNVLNHAGVPATGVSAVAITLTADAAAGQGFVKAFPAGTAEPDVSNLNPQSAGDVRANLVIVPVVNGQVAFASSTSVNLLADVVGWFTDSSAPSSANGLYFPLAPTRIADTRFGNPTTRPGVDAVTTFPFGSPVPSTASAVAYNLTGAQSASSGFLEAFPAGVARPDTSTVNFAAAGQDRAAFALSRRSGTGVSVYSSVAADEIIDVGGYFG